VIIETPGGQTIRPEDANASELVSRLLEHPMRFESQPRSEEKTGIDPASVFGDVPVEQMKEDWTPETMPDYFQLKSGSFFELGSVFLLASGSVEHLRRLQGGTAHIDQRRFRPNLYIDSESKDQFVEDAWLGGSLTIGSELVLHEFQPTLWCVTSTLAQQDLPRDLSILRATAQHHKGCLGVYAAIHSPGTVHVGDRVVMNR
jgi:MOSC domain